MVGRIDLIQDELHMHRTIILTVGISTVLLVLVGFEGVLALARRVALIAVPPTSVSMIVFNVLEEPFLGCEELLAEVSPTIDCLHTSRTKSQHVGRKDI